MLWPLQKSNNHYLSDWGWKEARASRGGQEGVRNEWGRIPLLSGPRASVIKEEAAMNSKSNGDVLRPVSGNGGALRVPHRAPSPKFLLNNSDQ